MGRGSASLVIVLIVGFAIGFLAGVGLRGSPFLSYLMSEGAGTLAGGYPEEVAVTSVRSSNVRKVLEFRGSGSANTPLFTAEGIALRIKVDVKALKSPRDVTLWWIIYKLGEEKPVDSGSVVGSEGRFEFYAYGLEPGSRYYVKVNATNCSWVLQVEELAEV